LTQQLSIFFLTTEDIPRASLRSTSSWCMHVFSTRNWAIGQGAECPAKESNVSLLPPELNACSASQTLLLSTFIVAWLS